MIYSFLSKNVDTYPIVGIYNFLFFNRNYRFCGFLNRMRHADDFPIEMLRNSGHAALRGPVSKR